MQAPSNVENFSPQIIRQISRELIDLTQNALEGIRVLFKEDDITNIQADIDGPAGTPYHGGSFRIRLILGKHYPTAPPKGFFVTKIFHPNVARNGEICVNTLKKDWNQDLGIKHILLTVKCLLIVPNPESALNEEAGKMLLEQYDDYCQRAKMMTEIHAPKCKPLDSQAQAQPQPSSSQDTKTTTNQDTNDTAATGEPVTKKLHTTAQTSAQQKSSQQSKVNNSARDRNRGLKRVLRLRS